MNPAAASPEPLETRIAPAAAVFELGNLNGQNGFTIDGLSGDDGTGNSVASIGDFNADGNEDFIVGAAASSPNGSLSGGAYVVFGTPAGYPAALDLATLDGDNGFKILGEAAGDEAGFSVSGAGDFDGDGIDDLIIGSPGAKSDNVNFGAAYILFGARQNASTVTLSSFDGDGLKILGEPDSDFGVAVAGVGDFNGDGFDDVLVGAPNASGGNFATGAAYVIFGTNEFSSPISVFSLSGGLGFRLEGENASDLFGFSVSSAGDVNGDRFADIIIGAPGFDSEQVDLGAAYVVYGIGATPAAITIRGLNGSNGFQITGAEGGGNAGASVASADLNDDGFSDVVVGSPNATGNAENSGVVHVVFGKRETFPAELDVATIDGTIGFKILGERADDRAGSSIASGGDFNRDGVEDLLIGAVEAAPNGDSSGTSYLVFGSRTGFGPSLDLLSLDGKAGFKIHGIAEDDQSGSAVSTAGDINDDGFDDLIVGAPFTANGTAYVIYGFDQRLEMSGNGKTFTITEADGDVVTLKLSQPGLLPDNIVLGEDGSIESLDLTSFGSGGGTDARGIGGQKVKALNLLVSVKSPGGTGNGFTKIGVLNANGVQMGKVKVAGDLGQIFAGGFGPTGVKSLIVGGNLGSDGAGQFSQIRGAMKTLKVLGNMQNDVFQVTGNIRAITIQKSLLGAAGALAPSELAAITTDGLDDYLEGGNPFPSGMLLAQKIAKMKIGGEMKSASIGLTKGLGSFSVLGNFDKSSLFSDGGIKKLKVGKMISDDANAPSTMTARNKIDSLVVKGDVENAHILVGYNADEQPVNADAKVGRVVVKGDWIGSSLTAGIADSTNDGFGRNDTVIAGDSTPTVLSRIASVVIKGSASGTAGGADHFGITAQQIGKVSIGGERITLDPDEIDDVLIDETNNDFRVIEIG